MKVLAFNNIFLRLCGIFCNDNDKVPRLIDKAISFSIRFLLVFGNLYCLGFSSATYLYHNRDDISNASMGLLLFFGGLSMFGSYAGFISNESNTKTLNRELQSLVNSGKQRMMNEFLLHFHCK